MSYGPFGLTVNREYGHVVFIECTNAQIYSDCGSHTSFLWPEFTPLLRLMVPCVRNNSLFPDTVAGYPLCFLCSPLFPFSFWHGLRSVVALRLFCFVLANAALL